jgi:hypothetical protein
MLGVGTTRLCDKTVVYNHNLDRLAESKSEVLARVREHVASYDAPRLQRAARDYGNVWTKEVLRADFVSQ